MRCWESPSDLPLVIQIFVSFRSFRCAPLTKRLHSRKDIKFLSLVEDQPVFPKIVCKNLLYRTKVIVKNSIYSNGDLDLWPNDPKINRVLHLPQGIMWPRLVKIRYTELKLLCGNLCGRPPAIPNHIIRTVSRRAYKNCTPEMSECQ
jgi:hypothetical protein